MEMKQVSDNCFAVLNEKNRVLKTPDGESGLNWLCAGLKAFFAHTERPLREMADLLKSGRYADEIMIRKPEAAARHAAMSTQSNPRRTEIKPRRKKTDKQETQHPYDRDGSRICPPVFAGGICFIQPGSYLCSGGYL